MAEPRAGTDQPGQRELANGLIHEGLIQVGIDGRPLPRLAARWELDPASKQLRVTLRPNITFHSGEPLLAPLAATILQKTLQRPQNFARYPGLVDVSRVHAVGDLELVFDLKRPSSWVLDDLELPLRLEPVRAVELEPDNTRLRVQLRPNFTTRDGARFEAPGIAATVTSLATDSTNLTDHPWLESISGIEATGNLELVVQLTKPSPPFAERFSQYLLGLAAPVGTGPYRLHQERSSETVLERFDSFYSGRPAVDRVLLRPYATMRTAWVSLLRSTVDMVTDVPANAVEFLSRDEVQIVSFPRRYQIMVAFNSAWGPFRSPAVRRALNAAVNRDVLIEKVLQGAGTPATGPLWPQNWAYDRSIPPFRFDTAGAEALLDQAGLRRPLVAGTERPPARFRFTCLLPGGLAVLERIALELQKQLYDIGVDVQFESVSTEEFERRINASEFEAVLIDLISGPTAARPFIFWRSRPGFEGMNVFGYENSEVEALFESLRVARNEAAIRSTTSRLQRAFIQDPPALAIAWNERARVVRRTFRIPEDPGRDPLLSLAQWTPVAASDR